MGTAGIGPGSSVVPKINRMAGDSDAVRLDIAVHHGIDGESGNRLDAQLLGDVLPMGDDSGQTDVQLLGNFLIYQTLCNLLLLEVWNTHST